MKKASNPYLRGNVKRSIPACPVWFSRQDVQSTVAEQPVIPPAETRPEPQPTVAVEESASNKRAAVKAIIDNRLYNTETAEHLFDYRYGVNYSLYRTRNSRFFAHRHFDNALCVASQADAIPLVGRYLPDRYTEFFGIVPVEA